MIHLTDKDILLLEKKQISIEKIKRQLELFRDGIPFVTLEKAAVISDGIMKPIAEKENELVSFYDNNKNKLRVVKFVPASGAASRMFKSLFNFLEDFDPKEENIDEYILRSKNHEITKFSKNLKSLPFYKKVLSSLGSSYKDSLSEEDKLYLFISEMLYPEGLNYGFYPKGMLPFHEYTDHSATPFEEHLFEAADYSSIAKMAYLHFTISEQHTSLFDTAIKEVTPTISNKTSVQFKVYYSYQKSSTDTIAVTLENDFFRNDDGSLLFRPGGHGALIENLNEQEADIIFIKNIDNVVVSRLASEIGKSKKVLAGLLLKVQQKAFEYAALLEEGHINGEELLEIMNFLETELNVRFVENFSGFKLSDQMEILKDKINRPIRICGMVKNEGEPGGGPFWIKDSHNHISLQIVESAQVNLENEHQLSIFKEATHFNPVDLVCGIKNYKGEKYNLLNFVDAKQGFITQKTKDGKDLKALELPGLWNGAMAFWNTIFVEVPLVTFNPVKTVTDLLKPAHQLNP